MIQELTIDQRVATILFHAYGYSKQEIAEFMGVPIKTAKNLFHSSELRLEERIIEIVEGELKHKPLSNDFTQKITDRIKNSRVD